MLKSAPRTSQQTSDCHRQTAGRQRKSKGYVQRAKNQPTRDFSPATLDAKAPRKAEDEGPSCHAWRLTVLVTALLENL